MRGASIGYTFRGGIERDDEYREKYPGGKGQEGRVETRNAPQIWSKTPNNFCVVFHSQSVLYSRNLPLYTSPYLQLWSQGFYYFKKKVLFVFQKISGGLIMWSESQKTGKSWKAGDPPLAHPSEWGSIKPSWMNEWTTRSDFHLENNDR